MHRDADGVKLISRRALLLGGGQAALLATLVGRMYYLQVVEASKYAMLADQNRINIRLLPPPRGRILDRNGIPLAVNQQNYRVLVVAEQTDDIGDTLDSLSNIVAIGDHDRARIIRESERRPSFASVLVRENLSWEEMSRVELNTPDLPGVMIDVGQTRNYPLNELGAHFLGYVSAVSENDLQGQGSTTDPLLELPGFRIGKAGVEKVYDLALRGKGGTSQVEVNAVGPRHPRIVARRRSARCRPQSGDRRRSAALRHAAAGRRERRGGDDGHPHRRGAGDGLDAELRSQRLQPWADRRRVEGPTTNPRSPLTNKAIAGTVCAGLDLQADDGAGGAGKQPRSRPTPRCSARAR